MPKRVERGTADLGKGAWQIWATAFIFMQTNLHGKAANAAAPQGWLSALGEARGKAQEKKEVKKYNKKKRSEQTMCVRGDVCTLVHKLARKCCCLMRATKALSLPRLPPHTLVLQCIIVAACVAAKSPALWQTCAHYFCIPHTL